MEDRKIKEAELHDRLRQKHDDHHHEVAGANRRFYAVARENRGFVKTWLKKRVEGKKVLDYCCGDGEFTIALAQMGAKVYGIDISPVSIENAKAAASAAGVQAEIAVMDAENTDFEDDFFDYIVVNGVLHHLDLEASYREMARLLKPGGEIIATEALKHNPLIHLYRQRTPQWRSEWEVEHILTKKDIDFARKYFRRVEVLGWYHMSTLAAVPFRSKPFFPKLLGVLEKIDDVLLSIPGFRWLAWMCVFVLSDPRPVGQGDTSRPAS